MSTGKYILDGKTAIECHDLIEWAKWFETADRVVKKTEVGKAEVSTVFLGIDHGFAGVPMLFETMIFGGKMDGEQWRYCTWEEAEQGHAEAVNQVEQTL